MLQYKNEVLRYFSFEGGGGRGVEHLHDISTLTMGIEWKRTRAMGSTTEHNFGPWSKFG